MTQEEIFEYVTRYLPYGLEAEYVFKSSITNVTEKRTGTIVGVRERYISGFEVLINNVANSPNWFRFSSKINLKLRPMSELTREELYEHWDDYVDYLTTERDAKIQRVGRKKFIEELPYSHFMYLVKNKFDIFGLLEQEVGNGV